MRDLPPEALLAAFMGIICIGSVIGIIGEAIYKMF
jgi:hypothetical protein